MQRLNIAQLAGLAPAVAIPAYDRDNVTAGIVHIGIGAFHRGHMAVYIDDLLKTDPNWAIVGASVRRPDTKVALEPQDYLYSVTDRDADGASTRIVGSVVDIIDASKDIQPLITRMADPAIKIFSLTVTEKGYCHDPASGHLLAHHPDIMHDLAHPNEPRSVPGIIVAALERRRAHGRAGVTVLSCDNLQGNGEIVRRTVLEYARLWNASLADWIEANVSFPSTMVDRIVPAVSASEKDEIAKILGVEDAWPVITEPFSQWVIEDNFAAGRPDLAAVGVQLVADVEPFELMKLRMLNGSHSTMAYLGQLAGLEFVSTAVGNASIRNLLFALMTNEVIPTLNVPGVDLGDYRDRLLKRFANPALEHRCAQIATDGSQKLPQRILMPIRERLAAGQSIELLCLSLAGWIAYLARTVRNAETLNDPLAERLGAAVRDSSDIAGLVASIFAITEIFGADLADIAQVRETVERHVATLESEGVEAAIASALARAGY